MKTSLHRIAMAGTIGATVLLGGCVVAPTAYDSYGEAVYVQPAAPVVVAPPVTLGIGIGGYYGRPPAYYGRPYYGRPYYGHGRPYYGRPYYGRPGYQGQGRGGRGYRR